MFGLHRRRFMLGSLGCGAALGLGGYALHSPEKRSVRRTSHALGTSVSITVLHESAAEAQAAIDHAYAEIELVESVLSIYRADSELSRLNRESAPSPASILR